MDNIMVKAEDAVREAGKIFLERSLDGDLVIKEGTANYATQIDLNVQDFLVKKLYEIVPGSNIITEESNKNYYNFDNPTWVLDPVDGTINIYHGYKETAISLAYFLNGKPAIGIVYNPDSGEMFTARSGKGAYLNGRKITVSSSGNLSESLISFGTTPYYRERAEENFNLVRRVFEACQDVRRSGSAALDICYIACGRTDGFFEGLLQPWDYAASITILEEAGGKITNWGGSKPGILHPDSILASNSLIHGRIMDIIQDNR